MVLKGDARSLDYGSYEPQDLKRKYGKVEAQVVVGHVGEL